MKSQSLVLIVTCAMFLCLAAVAQETTMQLFAPSRGWALSNGRLFWTANNGEHWTDISPQRTSARIADVFFSDESRGWVLLENTAPDDMVRVELALTTNGGHDWSLAPVRIPKQLPGELSGAVWVDFVDLEHGWIMLRKNSSSAFSMGRLIATQDGGGTWHEMGETPLGAPVLFLNPDEGWMVGDSGTGGSGNLYRTRDSGKTWQGMDLEEPSPTTPTDWVYGRLHFTDTKHGYIPVTFSPITDPKMESKLVLFTTADGGSVWKPERILHLPNMYGESALPSAFADSTFVVARGAAVTEIRADGTISRKRGSGLASDTHFKEISFASETNGWLRTTDGKLLSTSDGGETLTWLIPGSSPRTLPSPAPTKELKVIGTPGSGPSVNFSGPSLAASAAARGLHQSQRLGFDKKQSFTSDRMSVWWNSSPFFDVGFYVGGANYCYQSSGGVCQIRLDPNINAGWVTAEMNQGWGLLPIWVGPQSPCNTNSSFSKFDINLQKAQAQGKTEADRANAAMSALGLSDTVVFYDMEYYYAPVGSSCSKAVQAFLTGWVFEMNLNGYVIAGAYANPGPAARDFTQILYLNEVWIAQTLADDNNWPRVTIWGLGSGSEALPDNVYNNHNRGHQFLEDAQSISYGGVTADIDYDVEDFQIPGPNPGVKLYNWTMSSIDLTALQPAPCIGFCSWIAGNNDVVWNSGSNTPRFVTHVENVGTEKRGDRRDVHQFFKSYATEMSLACLQSAAGFLGRPPFRGARGREVNSSRASTKS